MAQPKNGIGQQSRLPSVAVEHDHEQLLRDAFRKTCGNFDVKRPLTADRAYAMVPELSPAAPDGCPSWGGLAFTMCADVRLGALKPKDEVWMVGWTSLDQAIASGRCWVPEHSPVMSRATKQILFQGLQPDATYTVAIARHIDGKWSLGIAATLKCPVAPLASSSVAGPSTPSTLEDDLGSGSFPASASGDLSAKQIAQHLQTRNTADSSRTPLLLVPLVPPLLEPQPSESAVQPWGTGQLTQALQSCVHCDNGRCCERHLQMLGEHLYPQVLEMQAGRDLAGMQHLLNTSAVLHPLPGDLAQVKAQLASKLTGMFLEMGRGDILHVLGSTDVLLRKVEDAVAVLRRHHTRAEVPLQTPAPPAEPPAAMVGPWQSKQELGERLFLEVACMRSVAAVRGKYPLEMAIKVARLVLEFDNDWIAVLLSRPDMLAAEVEEAMTACAAQRPRHSAHTLLVGLPAISLAWMLASMGSVCGSWHHTQVIRACLLPEVARSQPELAGRITDMLLMGKSDDDLLILLDSQEALLDEVDAALAVLLQQNSLCSVKWAPRSSHADLIPAAHHADGSTRATQPHLHFQVLKLKIATSSSARNEAQRIDNLALTGQEPWSLISKAVFSEVVKMPLVVAPHINHEQALAALKVMGMLLQDDAELRGLLLDMAQLRAGVAASLARLTQKQVPLPRIWCVMWGPHGHTDSRHGALSEVLRARLLSAVTPMQPHLATTITDMLLKMDIPDLLVLLHSHEALVNEVDGALALWLSQNCDDMESVVWMRHATLAGDPAPSERVIGCAATSAVPAQGVAAPMEGPARAAKPLLNHLAGFLNMTVDGGGSESGKPSQYAPAIAALLLRLAALESQLHLAALMPGTRASNKASALQRSSLLQELQGPLQLLQEEAKRSEQTPGATRITATVTVVDAFLRMCCEQLGSAKVVDTASPVEVDQWVTTLADLVCFVKQARDALLVHDPDDTLTTAQQESLVWAASCRQFGADAVEKLQGPPFRQAMAAACLAPQCGGQLYAHALAAGMNEETAAGPETMLWPSFNEVPAMLLDTHAMLSMGTSHRTAFAAFSDSVGTGRNLWRLLHLAPDSSCLFKHSTGQEDVCSAVAALDGAAAVAAVVGMVAAHGALALPSLELLQVLADGATVAAGTHTARSASTPAPAVSAAHMRAGDSEGDGLRELQGDPVARYLLDVVTSLPPAFCGSKGLLQVLLPAGLLAVPGAAQGALHLAAALPTAWRPSAAAALRRVSEVLGVPLWRDGWRAVLPMARQPTEKLPPPAELSPMANICVSETSSMAALENASGADNAPATLHSVVPLQTPASEEGPCLVTGPLVAPAAFGTREAAGLPLDAARAVIDDIRLRKFGVGLHLTPELHDHNSELRQMLRRSMKPLAKDLYSSKLHVLLELLQNADDCTFFEDSTQAGQVPTVALLVSESGLSLGCNERGFTEDNMRRLCDVGNSSKGRPDLPEHNAMVAAGQSAIHIDSGQTGEKGLGFKSVFAISDTPHIFSGGMQVHFNGEDPGGLGYVLPHWSDETPPGLRSPAPLSNDMQWSTRLWLPAAPRLLAANPAMAMENCPAAPHGSRGAIGDSGSQSASSGSSRWLQLAGELVDGVGPHLLLFLRRVRHLRVEDLLRGKTHTLERVDKALQGSRPRDAERGGSSTFITLISETITHSDGTVQEKKYQWLRAAHVVKGPPVDRMGKRVDQTIVEVALPLDLVTTVPPEVYAFLPIRSFALPFAVQADWLVPASREDISKDDPWNQYLRSQVPAAFCEAVLAARGLPDLQASWFRFLPPAVVTRCFFGPLPGDLTRLLRDTPCVLLATNSDNAEQRWARPAEALLAKQEMQDLIPERLLHNATGKYYADVKACQASPEVLLALGISVLTADTLVQVLVKQGGLGLPLPGALPWPHHQGMPTTLSDAEADRSMRLLALLEELLTASPPGMPPNSAARVKLLVKALADVPLIPASSCSAGAAHALEYLATPRCSPFLPASFDHYSLQDSVADAPGAAGKALGSNVDVQAMPAPQHDGGAADGFEGDLSIVSVTALRRLPHQAMRQAAFRCLQRFSVRPLTAGAVVQTRILPALQARPNAEDWQGHERALVGYAAYLLRHQGLAQDPATVAVWRDALLWVTAEYRAADGINSSSSPAALDRATSVALASSHGPMALTSPAAVCCSADGLHLGLSFLEDRPLPRLAAGATPAEAHLPSAVPLHLAALRSALRGGARALHPMYLDHATAEQWRDFCCVVLQCGSMFVCILPQLLSGGLTAQPSAGWLVAAGHSPGSAVLVEPPSASVVDYVSPDLDRLLDSLLGNGDGAWASGHGDSSNRRSSAFEPDEPRRMHASQLAALGATAAELGRLWSGHYDKFAHVLDAGRGSASVTGQQSSFVRLLTSRAWLPTTWGTCAEPGVVPLKAPAVLQVLGHTACYAQLAADDPRPSHLRFARALGMTSQPSVPMVMRQLSSWARMAGTAGCDVPPASATDLPSSNAAATLVPSLADLAAAYGYLESSATPTEAESIAGEFASRGLVALLVWVHHPWLVKRQMIADMAAASSERHSPSLCPPAQGSATELRGWVLLFCKPSELCWEDPTRGLLCSSVLPPPLDGLYRQELSTFFCGRSSDSTGMGVPRQPLRLADSLSEALLLAGASCNTDMACSCLAYMADVQQQQQQQRVDCSPKGEAFSTALGESVGSSSAPLALSMAALPASWLEHLPFYLLPVVDGRWVSITELTVADESFLQYPGTNTPGDRSVPADLVLQMAAQAPLGVDILGVPSVLQQLARSSMGAAAVGWDAGEQAWYANHRLAMHQLLTLFGVPLLEELLQRVLRDGQDLSVPPSSAPPATQQEEGRLWVAGLNAALPYVQRFMCAQDAGARQQQPRLEDASAATSVVKDGAEVDAYVESASTSILPQLRALRIVLVKGLHFEYKVHSAIVKVQVSALLDRSCADAPRLLVSTICGDAGDKAMLLQFTRIFYDDVVNEQLCRLLDLLRVMLTNAATSDMREEMLAASGYHLSPVAAGTSGTVGQDAAWYIGDTKPDLGQGDAGLHSSSASDCSDSETEVTPAYKKRSSGSKQLKSHKGILRSGGIRPRLPVPSFTSTAHRAPQNKNAAAEAAARAGSAPAESAMLMGAPGGGPAPSKPGRVAARAGKSLNAPVSGALPTSSSAAAATATAASIPAQSSSVRTSGSDASEPATDASIAAPTAGGESATIRMNRPGSGAANRSQQGPSKHRDSAAASHATTVARLGALPSARRDPSFRPIARFIEQELHLELRQRVPMPPRVVVSGQPSQAREEVGRSGERIVYEYLLERYPGDVVEWLNKDSEQGKPFDLKMSGTNGQVIAWIEVKSTSTQDKSYFEVSSNEWDKASQKGDKYQIYRVYGVGGSSTRLTCISDPYRQWKSGKMGMLLEF